MDWHELVTDFSECEAYEARTRGTFVATRREAANSIALLLNASDKRITHLECQLEETQVKFDVAETERQSLHSELETLRCEADNRKSAAETAAARLIALLNSTSWRITAPLRRVVTALRGR
jgi:hypothetical protein